MAVYLELTSPTFNHTLIQFGQRRLIDIISSEA
jgi:hypothetical protein